MSKTRATSVRTARRLLRAYLSAQVDELRRGLGDMRSRLDVGPPSLSTLQTRSDENVGRRAGAQDTQKLVFALIGAAATGLPLLVVYLAGMAK